MSYDWSSFQVFMYIDAPPDEVYARWVTSSGLTSFFVKDAGFLSAAGTARTSDEPCQPGDTYTWDWWFPHASQGEVLAVDAAERSVQFTFGPCKVRVAVSTSRGATLVHLVQSEIPTDEDSKVTTHLDCRCGWIHFLTVLKGVMEGTDDARERDPDRALCLDVRFRP